MNPPQAEQDWEKSFAGFQARRSRLRLQTGCVNQLYHGLYGNGQTHDDQLLLQPETRQHWLICNIL